MIIANLKFGTTLLALMMTIGQVSHAKEGSVDSVTVFKDRAQVTRKSVFKLKSGAQTVKFSGLTKSLNIESVRVKQDSGSTTKILGFRVKRRFLEEVENKELSQVQEKLRSLDREIRELVQSASNLNREYGHVSQISSHFSDSLALNIHSGKWTAKEFRTFISFNEKKLDEIQNVWKKLFSKYERLVNQRGYFQGKSRELASYNNKELVDVEIDLLAKASSSVPLFLEYHVNGAGWEPIYDIRVDSRDNNAEIEQGAMVWQRTGEDWDSANIKLSNVRSELKPRIPSLSQMIISWREVDKVRTSVSSKQEKNQTLLEGGGSSVDSVGLGSRLAQEFKVKGRQTVYSGTGAIKLPINRARTKYNEHLEVVASKYPHAYRKGKLKNTFGWRMARGPANIFYNDEFIQQTLIEDVTRGAPFFINAGINFDVQVKRSVSNKRTDGRILAGRNHFLREIRNWITNFSDRRINLRVYEQYPDSEIKEVTVKRDGSSENFTEDKENPSWGYWNVSVRPDTTEDVTLNLEVSVPADMNFSW